MPSLLIALTGATRWTQKDGTQRPTGFWAEEFIEPYQAFKQAGLNVVVATPQARQPVVDEVSLTVEANFGDASKAARMRSSIDELADVLAHPVPLEAVDPSDFDAVFIPGGHGPMQDLAVNEEIARILEAMLPNRDKIVAALCHGQAAFLSAGAPDGSWLFKGRRLTSFLDEEERSTGLAANAPWLLEERLRAAGADFEGGSVWGSHVVVDGNLVTAQNPASAVQAAAAILTALSATPTT